MAKRNALSEWLDQTKKLAKSRDYAALDLVDSVFEILFLIHPGVLRKHRGFFDDICTRYHKPNPLHYLSSRRKMEADFKESHGASVQDRLAPELLKQHHGHFLRCCAAMRDWRSCAVSEFAMDQVSRFVETSIIRAENSLKDIVWQWFEIIDFMFERPELVDAELLDEYTTERVAWVCRRYRKNNPLTNGMRTKFGKYWKDENGKWRKERRRRV